MRFSPVQARAFGLIASLGLACSLPLRSAAAAEPGSTGTVRVAGIVLKWIRADKEANLRRVEPMIREAAAHGARIVCTTECFLDGYAIADKSIALENYRALGEPIPDGSYYRRLAALAAELRIHLIAGMTEAAGDARYNTSVLIGPDGELVGKYRKQKLQHELGRNTPGNASPVFETPFGRIGIMICADRTEPSIVERICTRGADFLICPSGGMFGPKSNDPIVQQRSRENKIQIVFVHPAEFLVTGSDGGILSQTVLEDRLLIAPEQAGGAHDLNRVFYFDLPMVRRSSALPAQDVSRIPAARASAGSPGATNFNLILISLTNTRADHLGLYGYDRATSPNLDKLAGKSLVFRSAFTHASWTLPASVSLFSSTYPFTHGMMNRDQAQPLPAETVTFIDVLKTNGYVTAAFVGDRDYSAKFGHTARFDSVFDPGITAPQEGWHSYGVLQNTLPPAREWLRKNRDRKFVLLVQGYDTHCPFAVPKEDSRFDPGYKGSIDFTKCYWTFEKTRPLKIRSRAGRYEDVYLLKTKPTEGDNYDVQFFPDDVRHMIALYDGEIAGADALIGQLLDDVTALGLEQRTIIVFYSDHGDMFGKHGRFMRGGPLRGTFYDDVLRIPLIVCHPGLGHREVDGLAQLIDLGPTLLDFLGCQSPAAFRGRSLRPLLTGKDVVNEHVFAGAAFTPAERNPFFHFDSTIYSVRNARWKLIFERLQYAAGPQDGFELYDLKSDPEELVDVTAQNPAVLGQLKTALLNWLTDIKADKFKPRW